MYRQSIVFASFASPEINALSASWRNHSGIVTITARSRGSLHRVVPQVCAEHHTGDGGLAARCARGRADDDTHKKKMQCSIYDPLIRSLRLRHSPHTAASCGVPLAVRNKALAALLLDARFSNSTAARQCL